MLNRLAPADHVTLAGLGLAWVATSLLLLGEPDVATLALLVAFLCDKADGCLARRGYGSVLGPQLDALADVVIYLVPTAVLVSETLAVRSSIALVAGTSVVGFGVLRLARYRVDGRAVAGGTAYYHGVTAFHVAAWALVLRLAVALAAVPAVVGALAIGAVGPLMIAPVRVYATKRQFAGALVVGFVVAAGTFLRLLGTA